MSFCGAFCISFCETIMYHVLISKRAVIWVDNSISQSIIKIILYCLLAFNVALGRQLVIV